MPSLTRLQQQFALGCPKKGWSWGSRQRHPRRDAWRRESCKLVRSGFFDNYVFSVVLGVVRFLQS